MKKQVAIIVFILMGCVHSEAKPLNKNDVWNPSWAGGSILVIKESPFIEFTPLEQKILEVAMTCRNAKPKHLNRELLEELLLMEREFGVPKDMRGMLLASACTESGYNPNAEGDHKFSKRGKPKAIGLLQLWSWWEKPISKGGYAINRRDPIANARAWMSHIKKQYPKVRKKCRISRKHISRIWRVAWVTAIRAPKPEGRCNEFPNHYRRLKRWKRQWANLL